MASYPAPPIELASASIAPLEELVGRLNEINDEIVNKVNHRNELLADIEQKHRELGKRISSIKLSQYEFESSNASRLAEDEKGY